MGRGHAEVQNLADDVGREEAEHGARKLVRQPLAQRTDVVGRGARDPASAR